MLNIPYKKIGQALSSQGLMQFTGLGSDPIPERKLVSPMLEEGGSDADN